MTATLQTEDIVSLCIGCFVFGVLAGCMLVRGMHRHVYGPDNRNP